MPTVVCHSCGEDIDLDEDTYPNYRGSITCKKCKGRMHLVFSEGALLESKSPIDAALLKGTPANIPEQPLDDYREAVSCFSNGEWKASAVMARRAIQGALLLKKIPDDRPIKMIQDARKANLFTERQARLAETVTFFGGKGAHPEDDEINQVGELEAIQGLRVTLELLLALFPRWL